MDLYSVAKFLHVAIAILWIGGATGMIISGSRAMRANNNADVMVIVRHTKFLADAIFLPGAGAMLLLGLYMTWSSWSFSDAWVVIGILGVVATGAIGGAILTPLVKKIDAAGPGEEAEAMGRDLLKKARADMVLLFVIVWDMISKPAWSDGLEILAMAAVIVAGGLLFLRKSA